jgi:hypothetical protein
MVALGWTIPQFEDKEEEERYWRRFLHRAGRFDALWARYCRKARVERLRARRKHRATQRRKRRGLA